MNLEMKPPFAPRYKAGDIITIIGKPKVQNTEGGFTELDIGTTDCVVEDAEWKSKEYSLEGGEWSYKVRVNNPEILDKIKSQGVLTSNPEDFSIFGEKFVEYVKQKTAEFDPTKLYISDETQTHMKLTDRPSRNAPKF